MGLFNRKNKKVSNLEEAPLGYWEEASYMMVIPEDNDFEILPKDIIKKIKGMKEVTFKDHYFDQDVNTLFVELKYHEEEYKIGFFSGGFSLPEIYINPSFYFNEKELEKLKDAKTALTIFMEFSKKAKESFHLQLKIATTLVPNLIGLVDESAERLLPAKWATIAANSTVTPGPSDMFNIHAVYSESGEVWMHTHGLCRCGLTELEILKSNKDNYKIHYNLINTFASYIIDKNGEYNPRKEIAFLGVLSNQNPIVAICKSWTEALSYYKKLELGGIEDREGAHNTRTSPIFLYKTEEDMKQDKLSKVTDYDKEWGDNPIFFFSDEETLRMKTLAMERFDYVKDAFKDKDNKLSIKIGLPFDNGESYEHIWFELVEFKGKKFKAKLTQEPYNISDMHVGDEEWFTVEDVTDWIIFTPKFEISPKNTYLL